jgi:hypothetical protein
LLMNEKCPLSLGGGILLLWLLLGDAVDISAAEQNLAGRNADDPSVWQQFLEHFQRLGIVRIAERWNDRAAVAKVEVDI